MPEITRNQNARIIASVPDMTEDRLRIARNQWHKQNDMRRIINALAGMTIEELHNSLETCSEDEMKDIQGQLKGIKTLLGKINTQGTI